MWLHFIYRRHGTLLIALSFCCIVLTTPPLLLHQWGLTLSSPLSTRYQLAEARAAGADAALLIVAVLDDGQLRDLLDFAHELGLAALVETHDNEEIGRAVRAGARIIGVNCRNLRNFSTDVSLLERLVGEIPRPCLRVAESGMHDAAAIQRARAAGADAFLVGTALMRAENPGDRLLELLVA